jgi:hypothetical protein
VYRREQWNTRTILIAMLLVRADAQVRNVGSLPSGGSGRTGAVS